MSAKYLTKNKPERCVMARVCRQRKRYQANFSLVEYETWEAAETAARKWINSLIRNLPPPLTTRNVMNSRNASGVVGVHRHRQVKRISSGRNATYYSWIAQWPECKFRGGVKWPVKKFGEDDAFVLAVLSRRLETVDRSHVFAAFKEIQRSAEYTKILNLRRLKVPRRRAAQVSSAAPQPAW